MTLPVHGFMWLIAALAAAQSPERERIADGLLVAAIALTWIGTAFVAVYGRVVG